MAKGYCIGPCICGCDETNYQECSYFKKMITETQERINELKNVDPFVTGEIQLPSTNDYARWVVSLYNLSDNFLYERADLWRDYNKVLDRFYIEPTDDDSKRHSVRDGAQSIINELDISERSRDFLMSFIDRQKQ